MAATLNVQLTDPADAGASAGAVQEVVQQAFSEWLRHLDYTTGNYSTNVSFRAFIQPADVSLDANRDGSVVVRPRNSGSIYGETLGFGLTGCGAGPTGAGTL